MGEFAVGAYVRKQSGAFWEGTVVGHYSTRQTDDGVAVQLFGWEDGPVQIYPASAVEPCDPAAGRLAPRSMTVNLSEEELVKLQEAVRNSAPGEITVFTPPPSTHVLGEPVAWRWSFDGGATWCHGAEKPGEFRFGNPDIIEPLFALATTGGKDNA